MCNRNFLQGLLNLADMNIAKFPLVFSIYCALVVKCEAFGFQWMNNAIESIHDTRCRYFECCEKKWMLKDFTDLRYTLQQNVYGQNIMIDIIVPALKGHLMQHTPRNKALTISLHGRPGIGKNYVVNFVQNKLFHRDFRSKYVHYFTGRVHFPLERHAPDYKVNLGAWIKGNVSNCEYSLFIFDEVDKMPAQVLDAVTPYIDYHERIDGIDFRKSIFIFISNTGGDVIAKQYLKYWQEGKKRETLRLSDFEDLIRIGAFNEKGGFHRSEAIESSLIDHYIPFLPLEEGHIRKCIADEFRKRGIHQPSQSLVNEIIDDLTFGPEENPIFSNGGCKRISPKVATVYERSHFWGRHNEL